ncbi:hypothetical protein AbraIFM66950_005491 [Aspergillus brasiliensis]|nr:hypothetical protein AbraIFM66950_005491 [Aspergillus brasiliensis]
MTVPMTSLDIYMELLGRSLKTSEPADERHGYDAVESLIHEIQDLKGKCDRIYENELEKIKNNRFRAQLGPEIADRLLLPNASIIFDQDLPQERRSFREAPTLRVVVLKSPLRSSVLVLGECSKRERIDDDDFVSYSRTPSSHVWLYTEI